MVNSRTGCFPSAYLGAVHPMPSTGINGQLKAALAIAYFQNRAPKFGKKIQNMKSVCHGRFFIGVGLHNQSCDHEKSEKQLPLCLNCLPVCGAADFPRN